MNSLQFLAFFLTISLALPSSLAQESDRAREEALDYFEKWLREDVVYIIAPEEEAVFKTLTTQEEKENFIEQFWFRRDPDPWTAENEYKVEHYRRIAYVNEHFSSGYEGWRTDRGLIYILHGPPAVIETHPSGGAFSRPMNEGGGTTATYPFEVWTYRHIAGVGDDVVLEFVDRSMSGEYRLALRPEEKDALLQIPGAGLTAAEELGLATKADRPYFNPRTRTYPMMETTSRDNPFFRYETFTGVQSPHEIKYRDLKELVEVNIDFSSLPFQLRTDTFRLTKTQVLVPITVQIENKHLSFKTEDQRSVALVAVYGAVTSMGNRLVSEFDDEISAYYPTDRLTEGLLEKSAYQKVLVLEAGARYKLTIVLKDLEGNRVGFVDRALIAPTYDDEQLLASSVILANSIQFLKDAPERDEMFVIGDVKVIPNLGHAFGSHQFVGLYFQVYNAAIDQTTMAPSLEISFQLIKDGATVRRFVDREGRSIQYFSDRRVVVVQALGLEGLAQGRYEIRVGVRDHLSEGTLELSLPITLEESGTEQVTSNR